VSGEKTMTEEQWLACKDPGLMPECLRDVVDLLLGKE
jgi:hypothetical protein